MHFLIDESKFFIFTETPDQTLNVALVSGVILPYEARRAYLKKYKNLKKETRENSAFIDSFLDDLISWNVQGTLINGDCANISKQEAEKFRYEFLKPLYSFADKESSSRKESLYLHLDNLAGKGEYKLSLQDFFKVILILDTIVELLQLYLKKIPTMRNIDIRKIKLIIDDQCKAALMTLKSFIYLFLNCRSQEGNFIYHLGENHLFEQLYTSKYKDRLFFDATKFFNNIIVAEKANMDDRYPELKIADILANTATKLFRGKISIELSNKLSKILITIDNRHFNSEKPYLDVTIPETSNKNAISQFLTTSAHS